GPALLLHSGGWRQDRRQKCLGRRQGLRAIDWVLVPRNGVSGTNRSARSEEPFEAAMVPRQPREINKLTSLLPKAAVPLQRVDSRGAGLTGGINGATRSLRSNAS